MLIYRLRRLDSKNNLKKYYKRFCRISKEKREVEIRAHVYVNFYHLCTDLQKQQLKKDDLDMKTKFRQK